MKQLIITIAIVILVVLLLLFVGRESAGNSGKNLDAFAQCLADKKITMHGEDTCAYCQKEEDLFGDSFRLVPYVECRREPQKCLAQNITEFPTWVFPDGRRLTGLIGLEKLAQESGCALP